METKVRQYKYDNLKFILIFLVVFGHCLEFIQGEAARNILIWIYTFHMPVFLFISGYFSEPSRKNIINYLGIYIIYHTLYTLFDKYILLQNPYIGFAKPFWIMWYIFNIMIWTCILKIFDVKSKTKALIIIAISFVISILVGFCNKIEYHLSLSRLISFFPFFILGYYTKKFDFKFLTLKDENGKLKKVETFIVSIVFLLIFILFYLNIDKINVRWLYGAIPYKAINYTYVFKILWFLFSLSILILLNSFVTNKKIKLVSYIGANTLTVYLLHGFIVKYMRIKANIFVFNEVQNLLLAVIISLFIMILFGNGFIKKLLGVTFNIGIYLENINSKIKNQIFEKKSEELKEKK